MPNLPIVALLHMISAGPLAASTSTVLQSTENISMKEKEYSWLLAMVCATDLGLLQAEQGVLQGRDTMFPLP